MGAGTLASPTTTPQSPAAVGVRTRRRVRVLAAHRQPLYRDAVTRAIKQRPELELVGQAGDGREALEAIGLERPDVAILDRALAGLTGEQVLNAVARDGLQTRVLLIAADPEPEGVYTAIANGAAGYLTQDADARELCDAIAAVARGNTVLAPQLQSGLAGEIRLRAVHERPFLTDREGEILKLIAAGLTAPQIGRQIHLSTATVKTHLQHLYDKLGVAERAAAVAEAMRRGLVE
ncbi:MAG: two-component system, NarL family, nitrate/nitrite response regulator NarL [Thermoleophilaceae bacterium]|jgi:two-component system nitrate/nitrite response regulator NarL|nr:two-component system, NarL family, nitrate/nitrite response regulator NarL [Thermoleophilaceae bacterium]